MFFEVTKSIARPPAEVWRILTDKRRLIEGGFGITNIDGEIAPGNKLKLWTEASPGRAFTLKVTAFDAPNRMVWEGGMPLRLFWGTRTYTLDETAQGCRFKMREEFTGPLAGMIGKSMPDLNPSFATFADALKRHAEGNA